MNKIYESNIKAYSSLYRNDNAAKSYEVRVKVDVLKRVQLKKKGEALEIGYGTGDLMHAIAKKYPRLTVTGIEVVKEAAELYRKRYPNDKNVSLITTKAEKGLKLRKNSYDIILASHVLEHVENEEYLLKQVYEALKKNGLFILAVPDWGDFENHLHYRQYSKDHLQAFYKYGFTIDGVKGDGFYFNKLFYIVLLSAQRLLHQKSYQIKTSDKQQSESPVKKFISQIYYDIFVPFLLLVNRIDSLLFSHIDRKPMQWIGVFKK